MDAVLVADSEAIVAKLRTALQSIGPSQLSLRVLSSTNAISGLSSKYAGSRVLFFGSPSFSQLELNDLKTFCEAAGDGARVVGVGPGLPPKRVLEIVRHGAFDYLDLDDGQLKESLQTLLQRVVTGRVAATNGKMFCVFGPAGGSGASFLAINLAAALAAPNRPCTLIDLHIRGGDSARLLNVNPRYSIASLAGKVDQLDAKLFEQALHDHECGIRLLASPELFNDYRQISGELVHRVVQLARSTTPNVIIDLEDVEHSEQVKVLTNCDRVILSVRPDYAALYRVKKHVDFLLRSKVSSEQLVVVANRTGQPRELPVSCMEEMLGLKIEHRIPNEPAVANTAYNLGTPVVASDPDSTPAQHIRRLARFLSGEVEPSVATDSTKPWMSRIRAWSGDAINSIKRTAVIS